MIKLQKSESKSLHTIHREQKNEQGLLPCSCCYSAAIRKDLFCFILPFKNKGCVCVILRHIICNKIWYGVTVTSGNDCHNLARHSYLDAAPGEEHFGLPFERSGPSGAYYPIHPVSTLASNSLLVTIQGADFDL